MFKLVLAGRGGHSWESTRRLESPLFFFTKLRDHSVYFENGYVTDSGFGTQEAMTKSGYSALERGDGTAELVDVPSSQTRYSNFLKKAEMKVNQC